MAYHSLNVSSISIHQLKRTIISNADEKLKFLERDIENRVNSLLIYTFKSNKFKCKLNLNHKFDKQDTLGLDYG